MDVPKITTDCPDCKPLLEQQQAIIEMLVKQVEILTARLEKVEREGKRQADLGCGLQALRQQCAGAFHSSRSRHQGRPGLLGSTQRF